MKSVSQKIKNLFQKHLNRVRHFKLYEIKLKKYKISLIWVLIFKYFIKPNLMSDSSIYIEYANSR